VGGKSPRRRSSTITGTGHDMTEIHARVEELLGRMTLAEKAGQATQYFYWQLATGSDGGAALEGERADQPRMVEEALKRGEVGSLLFVTDPAQINRSASRRCSGST
jgi:beta-glucosidase